MDNTIAATNRTSSAITTEDQYKLALSALSKRNRPARPLRLLMRALEAYRQKRRIGWSRPQNKEGITTFSSFKLDATDSALVTGAVDIALETVEDLPEAHRVFLQSLRSMSAPMGFLFFQDKNKTDQSPGYESVTISLGRVAEGAPRFRDRFDLILDCPIEGDTVSELGRAHVYVDPYGVNAPIKHTTSEVGKESKVLHQLLVDYYREHESNSKKHWGHWTQDYIDYFAPRTRGLRNAHFPTNLDRAYALVQSAPRLNGAMEADSTRHVA